MRRSASKINAYVNFRLTNNQRMRYLSGVERLGARQPRSISGHGPAPLSDKRAVLLALYYKADSPESATQPVTGLNRYTPGTAGRAVPSVPLGGSHDRR